MSAPHNELQQTLDFSYIRREDYDKLIDLKDKLKDVTLKMKWIPFKSDLNAGRVIVKVYGWSFAQACGDLRKVVEFKKAIQA